MARISARKRKDGGNSYQVKFIEGGGRAIPGCKWGTETFKTRTAAQLFKDQVEEAGENWPTCPDTGVPWVKGKGFVQPNVIEDTTSFQAVAEAFFAWSWEEAVLTLKSKSASQWERDKSTYVRELLPVFGTEKIPGGFPAIEAEHITEWRNIYLRKKRAPATFSKHHAVLFSIMKHGSLRMKLRPDNPCQATVMPRRVNDKEIRFFQHGEWKIFRECLHPSSHLMMDVALSTGVRWGELSAFRKGDCIVEGNGAETTVHIHVVRAWKDRGAHDEDPILIDEFENVTWKLGPPKSKRTRWVSLKGELAQRFADAIKNLDPSDYVFVTAYGNPWRYPRFHTDRWVPAMEKARQLGVDKHLTPHMLRHTMVVWSLAAGVRIEVISEKLGHASIQITYDRYGGIIDLKDAAVATAMAEELLRADQAIVPKPKTQKVVAPKIEGTTTVITRRQAGRDRLARSKAS